MALGCAERVSQTWGWIQPSFKELFPSLKERLNPN